MHQMRKLTFELGYEKYVLKAWGIVRGAKKPAVAEPV